MGFLVYKTIVYRFLHPEKTETQLFMDMITGEPFK